MATVSQLPASLNLVCTVGNDFTLTLAVTENGSTWSSTGATLATDIIARDGTVVATDFTTAATDGQVTLTLTDTQTTALGVGVYSYRLSVTKSGNTRDWIAGTLSVVEAGIGGTTSSAASLSITTGAVSLSLTTLVAPNVTNIAGALPSTHYLTKVLIVGSSNAAGWSATTYADSWAGKLETALASTHTFINEAVAGLSPTYWVNPDATTGRSVLEDLLIEHRPHIVIMQFTGQNMGGPSTTLFKVSVQGSMLCREYGARPIVITPYIDNSYTTTQQDINAWAGGQLAEREFPVLNFASVWGPGPTIPAAVDSGDGTHLNNTGHLELYRQIPTDYLQIYDDVTPIIMPNVAAGLTVPVGATDYPASTTTWPAGSFTIGFTVNIPATPATSIVLCSWTSGTTMTSRIRIPSSAGGGLVNLDFAQSTGITSTTTVAENAEHHIAMTYNGVSRAVKIYVNGALTVSGTGESNTFTALYLGMRPDKTAASTSYRYRNLTVHSTELDARAVRRLASGRVPITNMWLVASLQDASSRPAGAYLQNLFGTNRLTTAIAL